MENSHSSTETRTHKSLKVCILSLLAALLLCFPAAADTEKKATIKNIADDYAISAKVDLEGSGTGYHAKLIVCTATAATSFGIQFDTATRADYASVPAFMFENIYSNNAGGQSYGWLGKGDPDEAYNLMLSFDKETGTVSFYLDGRKIKSVKNPNLRNQKVVLRVEGSARKKNDTVSATFSKIKLKRPGKYKKKYKWKTSVFITNKGLKADISRFKKKKKVVISGKITGISKDLDWDSAYDRVSAIVQFRE